MMTSSSTALQQSENIFAYKQNDRNQNPDAKANSCCEQSENLNNYRKASRYCGVSRTLVGCNEFFSIKC